VSPLLGHCLPWWSLLGPLVANVLAGWRTPLANLATKVCGYNAIADHAPAVGHSVVIESLLQALVGIPVYTALVQLRVSF
jgi:hypothetical protein